MRHANSSPLRDDEFSDTHSLGRLSPQGTGITLDADSVRLLMGQVCAWRDGRIRLSKHRLPGGAATASVGIAVIIKRIKKLLGKCPSDPKVTGLVLNAFKKLSVVAAMQAFIVATARSR